MSSGLLILIVPAGLLGVALLAVGLRGRRTDDHPICRRCRFDLVGVYPAAATCPECGRALGGRRAVRSGNRRRKRLPLAIGAVLSAAALAALGGVVASEAAGVNLNTYKPTALLVYEARTSGGKAAAGVLQELALRLTAGELSDSTVQRLVVHGLAIQADESRPWLPEWGDLIDAAWKGGSISAAQRSAYAQRASVLTIDVRERARTGDEFAIALAASPGRCGSGTQHFVRPMVNAASVGDAALGLTELGGVVVPTSPGSGVTSIVYTSMTAPPGRGVLTLDITITSQLGGAPRESGVQWPLTFSREIEVLPADAPLVRLLNDPAMVEAVRESIDVEWLRAKPGSAGEAVKLASRFNFTDPPTGLAFDAFCRTADGREWSLARIVVSPGPGTRGWSSSAELPSFEARVVDLILRPNIGAAESSTDLDEIWNQEVVIRDIPIEWPGDPPP